MDNFDIALRLGAAALAGVTMGLNRDLHGKPTGVRTLGLVGVGAALAVLAVSGESRADMSRVIQGILTGIGFLGVGVIVRNNEGQHVHELTTAACVWVTGLHWRGLCCCRMADRSDQRATDLRHSNSWRSV